MYRVLLKKKAEKQLLRLRKRDQQRVEYVINNLRADPFSGKRLDGEHEGLWTVRVWPYRIVYFIEKQIVTVTVVAIGHRKDVYRRL